MHRCEGSIDVDPGAPAVPLTAAHGHHGRLAGHRGVRPVQAGQRVLVTGASGGEGQLAVQIAHHLRARGVAVASSGTHACLRERGTGKIVLRVTPARES